MKHQQRDQSVWLSVTAQIVFGVTEWLAGWAYKTMDGTWTCLELQWGHKSDSAFCLACSWAKVLKVEEDRMKMGESGGAKKRPTHIPPMFMDLSAQLPVQLSPGQLRSAMEQKHISKDIQISKDWKIYASLHFPMFFFPLPGMGRVWVRKVVL